MVDYSLFFIFVNNNLNTTMPASNSFSWGEISFVSEPIQNFAFASAEKTMGSPGYDIDIEADDIDVTDTVTVIWNIK